jgi:hypothetical protein
MSSTMYKDISRIYLRWPIPFPGIPIDILQRYLGYFRELRERGALEEYNQSTVTPNQVLYGTLALPEAGKTGIFGFFQRIFAPAPMPFYKIDFDIRGGMKAPHIHLDGKIYLLNEVQWSEFSEKVIVDIQERLEKAKSIPMNFDQLTGVAEAAVKF